MAGDKCLVRLVSDSTNMRDCPTLCAPQRARRSSVLMFNGERVANGERVIEMLLGSREGMVPYDFQIITPTSDMATVYGNAQYINQLTCDGEIVNVFGLSYARNQNPLSPSVYSDSSAILDGEWRLYSEWRPTYVRPGAACEFELFYALSGETEAFSVVVPREFYRKTMQNLRLTADALYMVGFGYDIPFSMLLPSFSWRPRAVAARPFEVYAKRSPRAAFLGDGSTGKRVGSGPIPSGASERSSRRL